MGHTLSNENRREIKNKVNDSDRRRNSKKTDGQLYENEGYRAHDEDEKTGAKRMKKKNFRLLTRKERGIYPNEDQMIFDVEEDDVLADGLPERIYVSETEDEEEDVEVPEFSKESSSDEEREERKRKDALRIQK